MDFFAAWKKTDELKPWEKQQQRYGSLRYHISAGNAEHEIDKKLSRETGWLWNSQALQFDRPFVCFRYWSGVTPYCFLNTF